MRVPSKSNTTPSGGPQGTQGGVRQAVGSRPGSRPVQLGDEMYLWILVGLEVGAIAWLRSAFRRHHGG